MNPNEYVPPPANRRSDGGATTSMVCGILGLFFCPVASLIGVIMGHKAMGRIRRSHGALAGEGTAVTGVVTGYIGLVLGALVALPVAMVFLIPGVSPEQRMGGTTGAIDMKTNGRNIYTSVFADAVDGNVVGFPAAGAYPSSTVFFKTMADKNPDLRGYGWFTPDIVAGPHVNAATSWAGFSQDNNAWNVVEGLDASSNAGLPFLISANVTANSLAELNGRVGDNIDPTASGDMSEQVFVATTGGGSTILSADDHWPNTGWPDLKILPP